MAFNSTLIPGTFSANDAEWRVTNDCSFVVLMRDTITGENFGHCGPMAQWRKEVQEAARAYHAAWIASKK